MIKSTVQKLADPIGFEIGTSDDVTQAELLNAFSRGLYNSIIEESDRDMQYCYIADKLTPKAQKVILRLAEFIKTKTEDE